ncbi:hypothetical protein MCOR25_010249 [Pyricularia grisea]|nr:hypothetical protein MCOR25_010249 [Pyricularia grisea]
MMCSTQNINIYAADLVRLVEQMTPRVLLHMSILHEIVDDMVREFSGEAWSLIVYGKKAPRLNLRISLDEDLRFSRVFYRQTYLAWIHSRETEVVYAANLTKKRFEPWEWEQ